MNPFPPASISQQAPVSGAEAPNGATYPGTSASPTSPASPVADANTPTSETPPVYSYKPYIGGKLPPILPPEPPVARRPRRRWGAVLLALALLLVLGVGVALGAGIATARTAGSATSGIVIGASSAPNVTLSSSVTSLQQAEERVAQAVEPSVVKITSVNSQGEAIGSGDILTSNGYIVTNDHVVAGYTSFTVALPGGGSYTAQLVGQDAQDDLAVLKIAATGLHPIAFANSSNAQVGAFAIAIGYPLGLQETATSGIVSALNRAASEAPSGPAGELVGLVQTSAQLNPGNSGGALVNLQGQLIGIPTLEATNSETGSAANGIGYAISSNRVEYVASQLIAHGALTSTNQGFLGVQSQDVTPQVAAADNLSTQSGVLISGFVNDVAGQSPAQVAGLQSGDVIVAVNGQTVSSGDDLASAVEGAAPGAKVTLTLVRGSAQQSVTVTLGERPVSA